MRAVHQIMNNMSDCARVAALRSFWAACALAALLSGCANTSIAPVGRAPDADSSSGAKTSTVSTRKPVRSAGQPLPPVSGTASNASSHTVQRGDTLYSIAWRYDADHRDIAAWNRIAPPYVIYPGQKLSLRPVARTTTARATPTPRPATRPATTSRDSSSTARKRPTGTTKPAKTVTQRKTPPAKVKKPSPTPTPERGPVRQWSWPAEGRVATTFRSSGGKGIDIVGSDGTPIKAAASGDVVYSGSGLRGYGQLIIIKHNKSFLSAYAHNKKLHVAEGDKVVRGQRIADMGRTGAERIQLHFEIRKDGEPVDPFRYLPRKPGRR